jgi:hypothetical protein
MLRDPSRLHFVPIAMLDAQFLGQDLPVAVLGHEATLERHVLQDYFVAADLAVFCFLVPGLVQARSCHQLARHHWQASPANESKQSWQSISRADKTNLKASSATLHEH